MHLIFNRYHELFLIVDSCQSESMGRLIYSPNVLALGSSKIGEDSFSVSYFLNLSLFLF